MVTLLFLSLVMGFVFYSQQRVATSTAMSQAKRGGFGAAFAVLGGALAGDAVWAAAALLVFAFATQIDALRVIFSIVGSFFFLRLAWGALQDARQGVVPRNDVASDQKGFGAGARISFGNPYALGFWVGVAAALVLLITPQPTPADYVAFLAGIVVGATLWCVLIAWLAATRPAALSTGFFRAVNVVCGILAAALGIAVLWATVTQPVVK